MHVKYHHKKFPCRGSDAYVNTVDVKYKHAQPIAIEKIEMIIRTYVRTRTRTYTANAHGKAGAAPAGACRPIARPIARRAN
jgi:hypothetical protein